VAAALEQSGLDLVAAAKIAYVELALAQDRARLARQAASELGEIRRLTASRLAAGDISELEGRTAVIDAARAEQEAVRAEMDVALRANDLRARLGLALDSADIALAAGTALEANTAGTCGPMSAMLDEALASRPDVRAAELAIEVAGRRLGWERPRTLALTAVLDANAQGADGFEAGPGIEVAAPLFDRNQGGRARAAAELERATRAYVATRQRVATELREADIQRQHAIGAVAGWRDTVLRPLEEQVRAAERTFADGETSYLFVVEMNRRLTEARVRAREAEADVARALARTERAVGRRCGTAGREITGDRRDGL
jgi:cobalt-zinc-cadmium efflux system outer membrane protein